METTSPTLTPRPDHVPAERVVDFNSFSPFRDGLDLHRSWKAFQDATPYDIVWTPHNGGHWIALRGRDIEEILSDYERFTSYTVLIPKATAGEAYRFYPLSLDPPQHRPYRALLNDNLMPRAINPMEDKVRQLTIDLIEGFRARGRCNFIHEFSEQLPLQIFMNMVDLPLADLPRLKNLADHYTRPGTLSLPEVTRQFQEYLAPVIRERRGQGRTDLLSKLIDGEVNGRPVTDEEASNLAVQVLVGGLDTVLNFMGFLMLYLAENPEFRRRLAADYSLIPGAVMELLRRFPIVADAREVRHDVEYNGVTLKQGEMILAPTVLHGLDDEQYDAPLEVRLGRPMPRHTSFGKGVHICPGQFLARLELRVMLEEWLRLIPEFSVAPDSEVQFAGGIDQTVLPYDLVWEVPA